MDHLQCERTRCGVDPDQRGLQGRLAPPEPGGQPGPGAGGRRRPARTGGGSGRRPAVRARRHPGRARGRDPGRGAPRPRVGGSRRASGPQPRRPLVRHRSGPLDLGHHRAGQGRHAEPQRVAAGGGERPRHLGHHRRRRPLLLPAHVQLGRLGGGRVPGPGLRHPLRPRCPLLRRRLLGPHPPLRRHPVLHPRRHAHLPLAAARVARRRRQPGAPGLLYPHARTADRAVHDQREHGDPPQGRACRWRSPGCSCPGRHSRRFRA